MSFQGKEFAQGMKQLVINLKHFYDIEGQKEKFKAVWAIEQMAKDLVLARLRLEEMAEYD